MPISRDSTLNRKGRCILPRNDMRLTSKIYRPTSRMMMPETTLKYADVMDQGAADIQSGCDEQGIENSEANSICDARKNHPPANFRIRFCQLLQGKCPQ